VFRNVSQESLHKQQTTYYRKPQGKPIEGSLSRVHVAVDLT
jgi:hypothetical protein